MTLAEKSMRAGARHKAELPGGPAVTLELVAKEAGVSPSTVSRILNKSARVAESKTRAVEAAIAKLQFLPDPVARALARGKSMTVGVVTQALHSPFYSQALLAIERGLGRAGYSPLFISGHWRESDERKAVSNLLARRVEGIILLTSCLPDGELIQLSRNLPLIVTGRQVGGGQIHCLDVDSMPAARLATEFLIGQGHRRIAFVGGPVTHPDSLQRLQGYKSALAAARIPLISKLILPGDYASAGGYAAANQLVASGAKFTAIFAANDQAAYGVLLALYRKGLRVPRDVSVMGFDDVPESCYSIPPLTSVHRAIDEVGEAAAEAVIDMIAGRNPVATVPAPTLAIRESTRPLRS
jgi:LacI family transcriptional regulator